MSPSRDNIRSMYATNNNPPSTKFKTPDACLVPKKEKRHCVQSRNKKAKRNKILLESYWKNQATRLPWVTAAMKNFSAMVKGFVLQGVETKKRGKSQSNILAKLTFVAFEIWHIYILRTLNMLVSLLCYVSKLSTLDFLMWLEDERVEDKCSRK
ncbi:hypothetical protein GQ457_11G032850 [Hibiscus cannabinus]